MSRFTDRLKFIIEYKGSRIGEVYPVEDSDQWGFLCYKNDVGSEGLANTTVLSEIDSLIENITGCYLREKDLKHIKIYLKTV